MACKSKYGKEDLKNAISACQKNEMKMSEAAKLFKIPSSTLHDHLKGKHAAIGAGGPTTLSLKDEQEIVVTCQVLAEMGFGITKEIVETVVADYIRENNILTPFKNGTPGKDWWHRFKKRWPSLTERKPQHLCKRRAEAANEATMNSFFDALERLLAENKLDVSDPTIAQRFWNCDETAFSMSATSSKLLCKKGVRTLHEVGGGSGREYTTVHVCCCASGEKLPPFILYKGKNIYQRWMVGGPAGAVYGVTESGWMDANMFLSWFKKLFCPAVAHLTSTGSVLLFMDGHHSHISLELIRLAKENKVLLFCLPPNCTHIVQPLDVGVFAPVKKVWRHLLKQWKLESRAQNVSKEVFPRLICQLWEESITPKQCRSGFRASGIFPLNRDAVAAKLVPSRAFVPTHTQSLEDIRSITCESCGHSVSASPLLRTNLRGYFSGVLEVQKKPSRARSKTRIRIEGEVITSDEFQQYLESELRSKGQKKKKASASTEAIPTEDTPTEDSPPQSDTEGNIQYTHMHMTCMVLSPFR